MDDMNGTHKIFIMHHKCATVLTLDSRFRKLEAAEKNLDDSRVADATVGALDSRFAKTRVRQERSRRQPCSTLAYYKKIGKDYTEGHLFQQTSKAISVSHKSQKHLEVFLINLNWIYDW